MVTQEDPQNGGEPTGPFSWHAFRAVAWIITILAAPLMGLCLQDLGESIVGTQACQLAWLGAIILSILRGAPQAIGHSLAALDTTVWGRQFVKDFNRGAPRGKALQVSSTAFLILSITYYTWSVVTSLVSNEIAASVLDTLFFVLALCVLLRWLYHFSEAAREQEHSLGVQAIFGWWRIVPATIGVLGLLVTLREIGLLLF